MAGSGPAIPNALPALPAQALAFLARALGVATTPAPSSSAAPSTTAPGRAGAAMTGPGAVPFATPAASPAASLANPASAAQPLAHAALSPAMAARADGAALPQAVPTGLQATVAGSALPAATHAAVLTPAQAHVALADRGATAFASPLPGAPAAPTVPVAVSAPTMPIAPGVPTAPSVATASTVSVAPGATPPGAAVAASLAAPAAGPPQATSPAAMPAPAAPLAPAHAEARGNPMLAGGPAQGRADGVAQPHGHTVAATTRRSRLGDDPPGRGSGAGHALTQLGLGQARRNAERDLREQADRAFQRLYWLLTVTACICAGVMALVILLPASGIFADASPLPRRNPLTWIGVVSAIGLGAGLTAWWLARRR